MRSGLRCLIAFFAAALALSPDDASAQLVPHDRWFTIETPRFRVHFPKPLEAEARRGAVDAERAWAELDTELKAPRGKIDMVIADNVDYVNGYASSFPSNRIVIFVHPPIDTPELRNYDDWSRLVITHELAHIFHLDRAEGIWGAARKVFGRHPALFPNAYQPSWVVEGLAVYYESRVTGAGRLEGSEHYMIARAAAEAGHLPRLGELSLSTSRFPGGEVVYAYGGQLFDYLARTRGPETIPKFLDVTSRVILPLSLNRRSKRAFGISFQNAFRDWGDSLMRVARPSDPLPGWRELTTEGRSVEFPRWVSDTTILYTASTGRDVPAAYSVTLSGKVTRLGRRNALDANVVTPDGSILFSQPDYVDAFHFRTDLFLQKDGVQRRLTRGARLAHPDVNRTGAIVAVQSVPGSTRLVRVSPDGSIITPITSGTAEVQWAEPRWSPYDASIAAVRVSRGGMSDLVILDTLGSVKRILLSERAVIATPSWGAPGEIFYSSTRSGVQQVYRVSTINPGRHGLISRASTGLFNPELSPDGGRLAALSFRFDGYHVGYSSAPANAAAGIAEAPRSPRTGCTTCLLESKVSDPFALADIGPARRYSALRSLAPRYWEPLLALSSETGNSFGAATGGNDVIDRHSYYAQAAYNTTYREAEAFVGYQYAGLGQPFLNLSGSQEWERFRLENESGEKVGDLARRDRTIGLSASLIRPRVRTAASFAVGGEVETRQYQSTPDTLLPLLPELYRSVRTYPSVFTSAAWTNTRRPALSISREDGISVSAIARHRWQEGAPAGGSRSIVSTLAAYKSLGFRGFAHHVVALRGAAGFADKRAITSFSAGGLSGGSLEVLSGVAVGTERRTFGVRGFPPSAEQGIRAFAGTAEYRMPIAAPSRRLPYIPLLFDRISVAGFAEAGRAYCPAGSGGSQVCSPDRGGPWLASVGGELDLDTALQYDLPVRFRLGVAIPVLNRAVGGAERVVTYFTVGNAF